MENKRVLLYAIKCGHFYKIGITADMKKRMGDYLCMNPHEVEVVETISFINRFFARTAERLAHDHLKKINKHHRGEWFKDCGISEITNALNFAKAHANCQNLHLKYRISQRLTSRDKYRQGMSILAKKEKAIQYKKITKGIDMAKEINAIGVKRLASFSGVKQSFISDMRRFPCSGNSRYEASDLRSVVSFIIKKSEYIEGYTK